MALRILRYAVIIPTNHVFIPDSRSELTIIVEWTCRKVNLDVSCSARWVGLDFTTVVGVLVWYAVVLQGDPTLSMR